MVKIVFWLDFNRNGIFWGITNDSKPHQCTIHVMLMKLILFLFLFYFALSLQPNIDLTAICRGLFQDIRTHQSINGVLQFDLLFWDHNIRKR